MPGYKLADLNKVILCGRLTRDAEVRYTPTATAVATLPLALNRWVRSGGEWKEETTFVTVSAFGRAAELSGERLKKGSAVLVEGRLHGRSWKGPDGRARRVLEVWADRVQFLDAHPDEAPETAGAAGEDLSLGLSGGREGERDDDLPF